MGKIKKEKVKKEKGKKKSKYTSKKRNDPLMEMMNRPKGVVREEPLELEMNKDRWSNPKASPKEQSNGNQRKKLYRRTSSGDEAPVIPSRQGSLRENENVQQIDSVPVQPVRKGSLPDNQSIGKQEVDMSAFTIAGNKNLSFGLNNNGKAAGNKVVSNKNLGQNNKLLRTKSSRKIG